MVDKRLALLCGVDMPLDAAPIVIHQPKLSEIAMIGEDFFLRGIQYLIIDKETSIEQNTQLLKEITNFKLFIMIINDDEQRENRELVKDVLSLFFPDYIATFSPSSILLSKTDGNQTVIIDDNSFPELQDMIKEILCLKDQKSQQNQYNPKGEKAKEIYNKIMRGRKIAAEQNGTAKASIYSQYMSSLSVAFGISLVEISKMTVYQLYDLIERYMMKVDWDMDIKARLAGAKPDKHPDNWMKNIH